jgi:WD40 repeat protein
VVAAGGFTGPYDGTNSLYFFDRASGSFIRRIDGLPDAVGYLTFSPDNRYIAVALTYGGVRIYSRDKDWAEVARDVDYSGESYGASFAPDGRLVTTAFDSNIRLYSGSLEGNILPNVVIAARPSNLFIRAEPFGVAFSPNGALVAVGFSDRAAVGLLDGRTLAPMPGPDLRDVKGGDLHAVSWSTDGNTLFAGGRYFADDSFPVLAWNDAGAGARRLLPAGHDLVEGLVPLPDDDLLVAAGDPWLARLQQDGRTRWVHSPYKVDFRDQTETLSVSADGTLIDFGFQQFGEVPARFDWRRTSYCLTHLPTDGRLPRTMTACPSMVGAIAKVQPSMATR